MPYLEYRRAMIRERDALLRLIRLPERASPPARPIRLRLGRSLIRLGRRIAGEGHASPAWSG
jgi:hypothetical protein